MIMIDVGDFFIEELPYTYNGITTNEVLKGIGVK